MGGKAFGDTYPRTDMEALYFKVIKDLNLRETIRIGSSRWKNAGNDLDVAVVADEAQWKSICQSVSKSYETRVINNHCLSVRFPLGNFHHQVDLMQSKDRGFTSKAYFSSPYSKYKGVARNLLIMAAIKVVSTEEHTIGDRILRMREHFDLYDGIVFLVQEKSLYSTGRFRTIRRIVTNVSFDDMVRKYFDITIMDEAETFEGIYRAILSKYSKQDKSIEIFQECREMALSAKIEIPHDLLYWIEKNGAYYPQ